MVMTPTSSNIFLIGPMACGKTTLGKHLAERLNRKFFDSDNMIQKLTKLSINDIFKLQGEKLFRQHEEKIISELSKEEDIVLATGGGSILSKENRYHLHTRGVVVYLQTGIATQVDRIGSSQTRPLLKNQDKRVALEQLNRQRKDFYLQIADIVVDNNNKAVDEIGDEIINALSRTNTDAK